MSREDVEVMRRFFAAVEAKDGAAILELLHPDIEWRPAAPEVHRGVEQVAEFMRQWAETFDEYRWEPEEFIEAESAVVVVTREHGRGRGSGIETKGRFAGVWTIRDGKITRFEEYPSEREALAAVRARGP